MVCCYLFLIFCCVLRMVPRLVLLPSLNYLARLEFHFSSFYRLHRSLVCSWESGGHPFAYYCSGRTDSGRLQRQKRRKKTLESPCSQKPSLGKSGNRTSAPGSRIMLETQSSTELELWQTRHEARTKVLRSSPWPRHFLV